MSWTTFLALIAYFQNNKSTSHMLDGIDGLSEGMEIIMNIIITKIGDRQ